MENELIKSVGNGYVVIATNPSIVNWINPATDPTGLVLGALHA